MDIEPALANELRHYFFRFAGRRPVADDDGIDAELFCQLFQHGFRSFYIFFRFRRKYRRISKQLSCFIEDSHFAARPVSRVDTDDPCSLYRRHHQQLFCVLCKDLDRFFFCPFRQHITHFTLRRRRHQTLVGICNGIAEKFFIDRLFVSNDAVRQKVFHLLRIGHYLDFQLLFFFAAVYGQDPVIRDLVDPLAVIVIHFVHSLFFAVHCFCADDPGMLRFLPDSCRQFWIIGNTLRDDIACSLQSFLRRLHAFVRVCKILCSIQRASRLFLLRPKDLRQRRQPLFSGLGGTGRLLLFVWFIKVFHALQNFSLADLFRQFIGQFVLLFDEADDLFFSLLQISKVCQPFVQITEHHVGKSAGRFLSVTSDEWDGVAFVDQIDRLLHLRLLQPKFFCEHFNDIHMPTPSASVFH